MVPYFMRYYTRTAISHSCRFHEILNQNHNVLLHFAAIHLIRDFKHRKNCECCPVSLLIVRSQRLSWIFQILNCQNYGFRFSIVRIVISVSMVTSLWRLSHGSWGLYQQGSPIELFWTARKCSSSFCVTFSLLIIK